MASGLLGKGSRGLSCWACGSKGKKGDQGQDKEEGWKVKACRRKR